MSQTGWVWYLVKQDKIPILLDYFTNTNPIINYQFSIQNTTSQTLYFKARSDIPYSSSIVKIDSGNSGRVTLTLTPSKQSDGVNQTFNIYLDICTDSSCQTIAKTEQFSATLYWRTLSSVNIQSRFTFDDGTTQGWTSTIGYESSTDRYISPSRSLKTYTDIDPFAWLTYKISRNNVVSSPVTDLYISFLSFPSIAIIDSITINVDNQTRHYSELSYNDKWGYITAYLGNVAPSNYIDIILRIRRTVSFRGASPVYFDDITFFTIP